MEPPLLKVVRSQDLAASRSFFVNSFSGSRHSILMVCTEPLGWRSTIGARIVDGFGVFWREFQQV